MSNSRAIADRYAEAVIDTASSSGNVERVSDDLLLVKSCFTGSPALLSRLRMPSLSRDERTGILRKAFDGTVHPLTMRLIELLVRRGRVMLLAELYDAVQRVRDRREHVVQITIASARPMDKKEQSAIEKKLKSRFGDRCRMGYSIDKALIAGYRITSPEMMMDCSVRSGIDRLRERLLSG